MYSGTNKIKAEVLVGAGRAPDPEKYFIIIEASQRDGIMLAPGKVFRPHLECSPWMRFNVAVCEDTRVQRCLRRQEAGKAT